MDKKELHSIDSNTTSLTGWFHCFAGFSGDMALGCLIDAGADLKEVRAILAHIPIGKWSLDIEKKIINEIEVSKAHVTFIDDHKIRKLKDILLTIDDSRLPQTVADKAKAVFYTLAKAEAKIHNKSIDEIHFHELGAQDTIIDILGTISALEILGITEIISSPIATGYGTIQTEHGILPNPPPAVLEILKKIPLKGIDVNLELITPTGAALLETLATGYGPMPEMTVKATGYGAGSKVIPGMSNMAQVVLGKRVTSSAAQENYAMAMDESLIFSQLAIVETNLDDITGENLSFAIQSALDSGALDAWITPIIMKKGRPAHILSCLVDYRHLNTVADLLFSVTGTFGVRIKNIDRYELERSFESVSIDGRDVAVKVAKNRIKIEYDDAREVALHINSTPQEVIRQAEYLWHRHHQP